MEIGRLVIQILIFSLFISGAIYILADNLHHGNIDSSSDITERNSTWQPVVDKLNTSYETIKEQSDNLEGDSDPQSSGLDIVGSYIKGGYNALLEVFKMFTATGDIIRIVGDELQIPSFIRTFAYTIIILLVTITMIYMMFRFQPR